MIDDDFLPDRIQMRALGHLFVAAQISPMLPSLREDELYERVYEKAVSVERRSWLDALAAHGLIKIIPDSFRANDRIGAVTNDVCLTLGGIFYTASRAHVFGMNARTPTDDFPNEIVEAPWAVQAYFSPREDDLAPVGDRYVTWDTKSPEYVETLRLVDAAYEALKSDNEIGATDPVVRDEKLAELRAIRALLENGEGWQTKFISAGWGALGYLATSFADRPVGRLAEEAWFAIQVLVGIR